MKASALMARLDDETRDLQAAVDARWLELMSGAVTRDHYRRHLACAYGFEAPFESALTYTPRLVVLDRRERMRSGLIAQDLMTLGMSAAHVTALPQCHAIDSFRSAAEALGWKYVIERPAQLHSAIRRNVLDAFPDLEGACTYLSATNGCAPARWQQLGMLLEEVAQRPQARDAIIEGARAAFTRMGEWYSQLA